MQLIRNCKRIHQFAALCMYLKVDVIILSVCQSARQSVRPIVLRNGSEGIWLVVNIVYIGQVNLDIVTLGT